MTSVVVHNKWWIRFVLGPAGVALSALFWIALVEVVLGPFGSGVGARIVIGILLLACAVLSGFVGLTTIALTETFSDSEIRVRRILTTHRIDLASAESITQLKGPGPKETGIPIGRLIVSAGRQRALVDPTFMTTEAAMAVLDGWVRRRPELVTQDHHVRQIFEARGVLTPEAH